MQLDDMTLQDEACKSQARSMNRLGIDHAFAGRSRPIPAITFWLTAQSQLKYRLKRLLLCQVLTRIQQKQRDQALAYANDDIANRVVDQLIRKADACRMPTIKKVLVLESFDIIHSDSPGADS